MSGKGKKDSANSADVGTENHEDLGFTKDTSPFRCGKNVIPKGNTLVSKWHEQLEVKYILSGRLEMACGTKIICAEQGDIIVINPCQRHINKTESSSAQYHLLMVDLSCFSSNPLLHGAFDGYEEGSFGFENVIRGDLETERIVLDLCQVLPDASQDAQLKACGLFLLLFSNLKERHKDENYRAPHSNPKKFSNRQENIIEIAMGYIYEHYAETILLADIAQCCYVTPYHLCRIFKEATGQSPIEYLMEFRINKAAILLETTDTAIGIIGQKTGFADTGYFSRCFRKHKGVSPSDYRTARKNSGVL